MSPERTARPPKENWDTFIARFESFPDADRIKIISAYNRSKLGFIGKKRLGGERYFEHPRHVALILFDECGIRDPSIICAALLHDTAEDTSMFSNPTKFEPAEFVRIASAIASNDYYPQTAEMVISLTEPYIDGVVVKDKAQAKAVKYERLRNGSEEALLVKMADRLHNMRTFFPKEGEKTPEEKIRETEEILIPIFMRAEEKYPTETHYLLEELSKAIASLRAKTFEE